MIRALFADNNSCYNDCAVAIIRLAVVGASFGAADYTYAYAAAQYWSAIHPCLGIIAICLPTMRIFLQKARRAFQAPKTWSSTASTKPTTASHWLKTQRSYNELNDAATSLSGDTARDLHSNTIALALRPSASDAAEREAHSDAIKVTNDVYVERSR